MCHAPSSVGCSAASLGAANPFLLAPPCRYPGLIGSIAVTAGYFLHIDALGNMHWNQHDALLGLQCALPILALDAALMLPDYSPSTTTKARRKHAYTPVQRAGMCDILCTPLPAMLSHARPPCNQPHSRCPPSPAADPTHRLLLPPGHQAEGAARGGGEDEADGGGEGGQKGSRGGRGSCAG